MTSADFTAQMKVYRIDNRLFLPNDDYSSHISIWKNRSGFNYPIPTGEPAYEYLRIFDTAEDHISSLQSQDHVSTLCPPRFTHRFLTGDIQIAFESVDNKCQKNLLTTKQNQLP